MMQRPKLYYGVAGRALQLKSGSYSNDREESERGPLVLEVNSSPGLEGIEGATKINVAAEVATRLNKLYEGFLAESSHGEENLGSNESQSERAF